MKMKNMPALSEYQNQLVESFIRDSKGNPDIKAIYISSNANKEEQIAIYITLFTEAISVDVTELCLKYRNEDIYVSVEEEGYDFPSAAILLKEN